jgi:hypothetical protein
MKASVEVRRRLDVIAYVMGTSSFFMADSECLIWKVSVTSLITHD